MNTLLLASLFFLWYKLKNLVIIYFILITFMIDGVVVFLGEVIIVDASQSLGLKAQYF